MFDFLKEGMQAWNPYKLTNFLITLEPLLIMGS